MGLIFGSFSLQPWTLTDGRAGWQISGDGFELAWCSSYDFANAIVETLIGHKRCIDRATLGRDEQRPGEVDELVALLDRARKAIHVAICPTRGCLETCELIRAQADRLRRGR